MLCTFSSLALPRRYVRAGLLSAVTRERDTFVATFSLGIVVLGAGRFERDALNIT